MRDLPSAVSWRAGVFTHAEALACGWTISALRHAVRHGDLLRLRTGVYAVPPSNDPGRAVAALTHATVGVALSNHGVRASHLGAARLVGVDVWAPRPRPCVTHEGAAVGLIPGVHAHRAQLTPHDRARLHDSLLVTAPARSVVDIAREFGAEAGVVAADGMLRTPWGDRARLDAAVARARGRPHVTRAEEAVALADARSESVLESRSRYRMRLAGLPAPQTQVDIVDLHGVFHGRVDFYWPEFGVVGEADGRLKYRDDAVPLGEKYREDALRDLGLQFARWGWSDLEPFTRAEGRIRRAFGRGETVVSRRRWRAVQRPLNQLPPRMVV